MIHNISLNQEPIRLSPGTTYFVIDVLYIDDVKQAFEGRSPSIEIDEIRKIAFPYNDRCIAEFKADTQIYDVKRIKSIKHNSSHASKRNVLASDTGLLLFVNKVCFWDFIVDFTYDKLLDSDIDLINESFWETKMQGRNFTDFAIVTPQSEEFGVMIGGSGEYEIT